MTNNNQLFIGPTNHPITKEQFEFLKALMTPYVIQEKYQEIKQKILKETEAEFIEMKNQDVQTEKNKMYILVSRLLLDDWKKLSKRDTRLKIAYELLLKYDEESEELPEKQLAAETEFTKQTGIPLIHQ